MHEDSAYLAHITQEDKRMQIFLQKLVTNCKTDYVCVSCLLATETEAERTLFQRPAQPATARLFVRTCACAMLAQ